MSAGNGNDTVLGEGSRDVLSGGNGNDQFFDFVAQGPGVAIANL